MAFTKRWRSIELSTTFPLLGAHRIGVSYGYRRAPALFGHNDYECLGV
jgi:hypothetical protein